MSRATSTNKAANEKGWFRRVASTPLRALLRGKLGSDRQAVAQAIEDAELPPSIQQLIERITDQSRLWRSEKIEIALELAGHFRDGLDAGRSSDDLIGEFGDIDQAVRLIRRAKKRTRPVWWRASKRTVQTIGLTVATAVVLYLLLAARYFAGSPNPARDYVAEINAAAAAVPEDERAWPVYRSAMASLKQDEELWRLLGTVPGQDEWLILRERLPHHDETIAALRRGARKPALGFVSTFPLQPEDREYLGLDGQEYDSPEGPCLLIGMLLPYLADLRSAARVLAADVRLAMEESDGPRAHDNIVAMLRISTHADQHPTLINRLVSFSILTITFQTLSDLLGVSPELLSDDDLRHMAHRIVAETGSEPLRVELSGERMFFADIVQHIYTDDGRGGGRLTPDGMKVLIEIDSMSSPTDRWHLNIFQTTAMHLAGIGMDIVMADRRELMRKYDEIMSLMEREIAMPLWDSTNESEQRIQELADGALARMRYLPIVMLMPAIHRTGINAELTTQRRDAMQTAIALEMYRRRHGDWPQSLDDLTPDLLPRVPIDRFGGRSLRYMVRDGHAMLYSIGSNLEDNGGLIPAPDHDGRPNVDATSRWFSPERLATWSPDDRARQVTEGDWVLWWSKRPLHVYAE